MLVIRASSTGPKDVPRAGCSTRALYFPYFHEGISHKNLKKRLNWPTEISRIVSSARLPNPDLPYKWLVTCEPQTWLNRHFHIQREAVTSQRCLEPQFAHMWDSTRVQMEKLVCYSVFFSQYLIWVDSNWHLIWQDHCYISKKKKHKKTPSSMSNISESISGVFWMMMGH